MAENVAIEARKTIDACVHGSSTATLLAKVDDLLQKAEDMIVAAEAMQAKERAEAAALMIEQASSLMEELAEYDEFSRLIDEIEASENVIAGVRAGVGSDAPSTPAEAADSAARHVTAARAELNEAPPRTDQVKARRQKCKELTSRIRDVRNALRR